MLLTAIAGMSVIANFVQIVETYSLWKVKEAIPKQVEEGAVRLVRSEKFRSSLISAAGDEIAHRVKVAIYGKSGGEKKLENAFAKTLLDKGDPNGLGAIMDFLPKKSQKMLNEHPKLLGLLFKLLPDVLEGLVGAGENGEGQTQEGY